MYFAFIFSDKELSESLDKKKARSRTGFQLKTAPSYHLNER